MILDTYYLIETEVVLVFLMMGIMVRVSETLLLVSPSTITTSLQTILSQSLEVSLSVVPLSLLSPSLVEDRILEILRKRLLVYSVPIVIL